MKHKMYKPTATHQHGKAVIGKEKAHVPTKVRSVKDKKVLDVFGILFHTQKSLNEFTRKTGSKAFTSKNEYQHHYSSLIYNIKVGEESLDISVPLVMYNYKQEVSGAAIAFELEAVTETSEAVAPIAQAKAAELMETEFHKTIMRLFPTAELIIGTLQQVHKHP